jgi:hypothetical protein
MFYLELEEILEENTAISPQLKSKLKKGMHQIQYLVITEH